MYGLKEIRRMNRTPETWSPEAILMRDGRCYYEKPDGSLRLCEWEHEKELASSVKHGANGKISKAPAHAAQ